MQMRLASAAAAMCVALAGPADGQDPRSSSRGALTPGSFAIRDVNVVPMTLDTVIRQAVVLVRDGRIAAVGSAASVRVPPGTRVFEGDGRYLIPGLADMHTHLYSDGELPDSLAPAELGVMVANGVTAVRLMAGTPEQVELRARVAGGNIIGPQLWLASPMFAATAGDNVRVVTDAGTARAAVRESATNGYDFIKVTFGITGDVYDAVVTAARSAGLPVAGHVEPELGLDRAIATGQQLEHLDAFFEEALADSSPIKVSLTQMGAYRTGNWASLDHVDERKVTELAQRVARAGAWIGPTLHAFNQWFSTPYTDEELRALPDWQFIPNAIRAPYMRARANYWSQAVARDQRARYAAVRNSIVRQIAQAGGRLLAGSDTPDLLMAYGFGLHHELKAMVGAGLTPYQALLTATRNPAEFLGAMDAWGTIEVGKRADLVLVDGNPLADIGNTQRIHAVVIGGRLLDREQLRQMITAGSVAVDGIPRR